LAILAEYENYDPSAPTANSVKRIGDFIKDDSGKEVLRYVNSLVAKAGLGSFQIEDVVLPLALSEVDKSVRSALQLTLRALGELVYRYRTDALILSGRTSRLPAVRSILAESAFLPPHRIIPLHAYRVGSWYPFRDDRSFIGDPKTTAAVGAMVCLLGEGNLQHFNLHADNLSARSTARYFGKVTEDRRLPNEDIFYDQLDLEDPNYQLPDGCSFEFRGPMVLGFKQLKPTWWPATKQYFISYATQEDAAAVNRVMPLQVVLRLKPNKVKDPQTREDYVLYQEFEIQRIVDKSGSTVGKNRLRLRLQSLDEVQGYWLDTGILLGK
jgi:hypothetical protein